MTGPIFHGWDQKVSRSVWLDQMQLRDATQQARLMSLAHGNTVYVVRAEGDSVFAPYDLSTEYREGHTFAKWQKGERIE